jgi:hypothetical protein
MATTTTTATVNLHMKIRYEEKKDDDQLVVSIEEDSSVSIEEEEEEEICSVSRTAKEALERLHISSSSSSSIPAPTPSTLAPSSTCGVRFGNVSIRQYSVIVGDNPGGHAGPPLSIGWEHDDEVTLDVLEYEQQRPPRRKGREMLVPVDVRVERLRDAGYSRSDIVALTKPVNLARTQRRRTLETLHLQPLYQLHEKLSRKTLLLLTGGRRKRSERKLLAAHRPETASLKTSITGSSNTAGVNAPSPPATMTTVEDDERSNDDDDNFQSYLPLSEDQFIGRVDCSEDGMVHV